MKGPEDGLADVVAAQQAANKPLAVVLAGHNGSGKSTLWAHRFAPRLKMPLVNADRMMMSILPDRDAAGALPEWATALRDGNRSWMQVAQKGVESFVAHAMAANVPFGFETVFSHLEKDSKGAITASKIDRIREMQAAGYFVLLVFVGLATVELSIARVKSRKAEGGHDVRVQTLVDWFPRTREAVRHALGVADASLLVDNSRTVEKAFAMCRTQVGTRVTFDVRTKASKVPAEISAWLNEVSPA